MRVIPESSAWSPYPEGKVEKKIERAPVAKAPDPYDRYPTRNPYSEVSDRLRKQEIEKLRYYGYYGHDPRF